MALHALHSQSVNLNSKQTNACGRLFVTVYNGKSNQQQTKCEKEKLTISIAPLSQFEARFEHPTSNTKTKSTCVNGERQSQNNKPKNKI
jgi:hypothetical protein